MITSSATEARTVIMALLAQEFKPEGIEIVGDLLHRSVGNKGARIGVSPLREAPWTKSSLILQTNVFVQFYNQWEEIIDPLQIVDPTTIEVFAERFKRKLFKNDPNTNSTWFFSLISLAYPPDPTDNITRFEATVTAWGNNPSVVETLG